MLYRSVVCLFVTFVHSAQTAKDIDKIAFAYDSPMSLPDRVKTWLTSVNPSCPKFASYRYESLCGWFRMLARLISLFASTTTVSNQSHVRQRFPFPVNILWNLGQKWPNYGFIAAALLPIIIKCVNVCGGDKADKMVGRFSCVCHANNLMYYWWLAAELLTARPESTSRVHSISGPVLRFSVASSRNRKNAPRVPQRRTKGPHFCLWWPALSIGAGSILKVEGQCPSTFTLCPPSLVSTGGHMPPSLQYELDVKSATF